MNCTVFLVYPFPMVDLAAFEVLGCIPDPCHAGPEGTRELGQWVEELHRGQCLDLRISCEHHPIINDLVYTVAAKIDSDGDAEYGCKFRGLEVG